MSIELERAQAALVAALTGTGPAPAGFDAIRLDIARKALLRKRSGEVAKSWPMLQAALGTRFLPSFSAWAADRPTAGGWRDGFSFAYELDQRGELPAAARSEWQRQRLRWSLDRTGAVRRRSSPAVAVVDGRLLVQIGGRVAGWGPGATTATFAASWFARRPRAANGRRESPVAAGRAHRSGSAAGLPAGGTARGVVKFYKTEKGWGAITCSELPAGQDAFVHFSSIDGAGYRALSAGDVVDFKYVRARQDSFAFVATWARRVAAGPPPTLRRVGQQVIIAEDGTPDTPLTPRRRRPSTGHRRAGAE